MAKIKIERKSEWNNKLREFEIYIDGKKVGTIGDGETQEYNIESGKHIVLAKIDWCRSQKIEFNAVENEVKILKLNGFKYKIWTLPLSFGIMLTYFMVKYILNINLIFLIGLGAISFLYPMYFITFGKNRYLILTEKK